MSHPKVNFPFLGRVTISPCEGWEYSYDKHTGGIFGTNEEDRFFIQMWGNQSGSWGICITYMPIDSWPSQKTFEFLSTTNLNVAEAAVSLWLSIAIFNRDGRKLNHTQNHFPVRD